MYEITPLSVIPPQQFFAIMTAHPLVGIFGSTYALTFMILAALSGSLLLLAFLAFFYNIVMSLGIRGVIGILPRRS